MSGNRSDKKQRDVVHWRNKFAHAIRGIVVALRTESSFAVHVPIAAAVVAVGIWLRLSAERWAALVLCIAVVLAAELFNSALERMAAAMTKDHSKAIGRALDMASGAVLVAAIGAAVVGLIVLGPPLWANLLAPSR